MHLPAAKMLFSFIIAFVIGSIPFSLIAVRLVGRDIRSYGEGNPGTANAFRAGGMKVGVPALILDSFKGVVPVAILVQGASYWQVPIISISPVLGHAFSPFLKFRGGKAIATSFGIWTALTVWWGPCAMGLGALASVFLFKRATDVQKTLLIFLSLGLGLALSQSAMNMWALYAANIAIVLFKQHQYAKLTGR